MNRRHKSPELQISERGGYSRSYSERNFHLDKTRHHEKQINQTIQSETRVSFERNAKGDIVGPFGSHTFSQRTNIRVTNGLNSSSDYNNTTLFIRENVGSDTIHPIENMSQDLCMGKTDEVKSLKLGLDFKNSLPFHCPFGWIFSEDTWLEMLSPRPRHSSINLTHLLDY